MVSIIIGWSLIGLLILLFFVLAFFSNILRDGITDMAAFQAAAAASKKYKNTPIDKVPRPFSFSRTQLAVWTTIIACSYIFLGLIYSEKHPTPPPPTNATAQTISDNGGTPSNSPLTFNTTILILMGISAGSATFANIIDSNQSDESRHQNEPSHGFFTDLLSDQNGVCIHRFQNFVWTLVCISIYFYMLCIDKRLPELDPTLVALTGISSATYLTLKVNENKNTGSSDVPPAPAPPAN